MPTTPSLYETTGLDIELYKPAIVAGTSYTPESYPLEGNLAERVTAYSHVIQAFGGYWSAMFALNILFEDIGTWLTRLGSHLIVFDSYGLPVWVGFVNQITITAGGLSITVGPLSSVGNRVQVVYSTVDTSTDPPTIGVRARTAVANNTAAQDRYGIIVKTLSTGGSTTVSAEQIRDTWLAENALPITAPQYMGEVASPVSVSVECLGYIHWLKFYPYNQTTNTGTANASTKIQNVLAADLNGLFSTSYFYIETNTLQVKRWEDSDSTAFSVIQGIVAMGDANSNRYLFGVYDDQVAYYEQAPTELEYEKGLSDRDQRVRLRGGLPIAPWNVRPGKWLFYTDFDTKEVIDDPNRDDYRFEFIESVTYTAPYGLQHYGGKLDNLPQILARLGLGGLSS